ncbi:hypothetical protein BD309DRAFT_979786 [Dichomitus squalens]|uniref:Uncharacterized protein n=1 Tax=Dichomitus squalens TaxID=114155 RepID=A0A4Q9NXR4_9APHY|nr:hypothetical protein BD311DRAFT_806666 [Dichomitus squalens]TBU44911.1 hypothetical protein BD309DRAFT_979786 [Dichomitus squalens]TBU54779.1 hypothetical protein BD310DRAFT_980092 [Dichomitus squalens]
MITDSDPNGERGYGLPNPLVEEWLLDHYVRSVPLLSDTDTFEEIEDVVRKYHQLPFRTSGEAQERLASHHWEDGGGPQLPLALYDLLQRVNEVYPSQDGKQIQLKLCVLAHQEVKTVRCFEFDRLQQHPGELPFTGIAKGLQDHYWHLERIHRSKTRSNRQTEQAETWAACSVAYANWEIADCSRKLQRDPDLVDVARKGRDGMMHRLQAYPVGVEVDLAYTVAIKGLLHELVHRFGDVHGGRTFANMRVFSSNPPNRNLALDACDSEFDVHLPVLLINHQSQASRDKLQTETRNKQRVAVASAAWFFRTMGIVDFPVYGLAVCGSRGYLTQAWYSDAHNCCYLVDRNILENPLDLEAEDGEPRVYNFLSRLNEHAKQLEEHFNASREQVYARAQSQDSEAKLPFLDWTALSQMEQYQGEFSTSDEDEL